MDLVLDRRQLGPIRLADDRVEERDDRIGGPLDRRLFRVAHQVAEARRVRLLRVVRRQSLAARNRAEQGPQLPAVAKKCERQLGPTRLRAHQLARLEMLAGDDQLHCRVVEVDESPGLLAGALQDLGRRQRIGEPDEEVDRAIDLAGRFPFPRRRPRIVERLLVDDRRVPMQTAGRQDAGRRRQIVEELRVDERGPANVAAAGGLLGVLAILRLQRAVDVVRREPAPRRAGTPADQIVERMQEAVPRQRRAGRRRDRLRRRTAASKRQGERRSSIRPSRKSLRSARRIASC